jgi:hypothetical protein
MRSGKIIASAGRYAGKIPRGRGDMDENKVEIFGKDT